MGPEAVLQALLTLWDELPALVGPGWTDLFPKVERLLDRLQRTADPDERASLSADLVLLFREHPRARQRLQEAIQKITRERAEPERGEAPEAPRGLGWSELLAGLRQRLNPPPVTRYTDITCPRRVWVEAPRISVVVRLTVHPPTASAAVEELEVREGLPVRVRVEAPAFDVLNEPEQETTVLPHADSPPLVFDLRPRRVSPTRVNLDFFQAGNPVGTASIPVEITGYEVGSASEHRPGQALRLEPGAASPDLMLYITCERFQDQPAFVFTLFRAGEVGRTFEPILLESDPMTYAARLYEHLTVLSERLDPTAQTVLGRERILSAEDVDRRLRQLGQNLWRDLVPRELKALYATEREAWRDKTLLIVSDEPYIPWELTWPYEPGGWQDDGPWCMSLRLTRWLRRDFQGNGHEAPPARLRLSALACLAPTDSGLPAAQQEQDFLRKLVQQHNLKDVSPNPATWSNVMDMLEAGEYNWLHVAAHGNFYPRAPEADSAIWLQDGRTLTPDGIVGPTVEGHINSRRPAFVFNACHSARQGWTLTRLGGWANRLISTGAGLFIAPLWTVTDGRALDFAKTFYHELLAGRTVAEAVRQARMAAQRAGDPTWLAYSVYAHPNARVVFGTDEAEE